MHHAVSIPPFTQGWVYNLEVIPDRSEAGRVIALALTFSTVACLLVLLRFVMRWKVVGLIGVGTESCAR